MIVIDVNVLIAAFLDDHADHAAAREWLDEARAGGEGFGVPATVWHSFLRLCTKRQLRDPSIDVDEAFAFVHALRGSRQHTRAEPGPRHFELLADLCRTGRVRSDLIPDAAIAAIAIENGAGVASFDRDFARFPGLRWTVPGE